MPLDSPRRTAPVSFGIVSPGRWGRKLLDAVRASEHLKFAGVFSRDASKRSEITTAYGGRSFDSFDALLAAPDVEAVLLPTPHFLHHAQALAALRAGKHVFVEKPIATSLEQAEEMNRVAKISGRTLAVGLQGRHTGGIRSLKAKLAAGELGEVCSVVVLHGFPHALARSPGDWRADASVSPGGQIDELGVHYFDVLQFLFGPVRRVTGFIQRRPPHAPPSSATVALEFSSGLVANYTTYDASVAMSRLTVLGTRGCLEMNRMGQDACTWQPVSDATVARLGGHAAVPIQFEGPYLLSTALTAELEDFAAAIRENRPPQVGATEAISTLRISRAVMEASVTGHTVELSPTSTESC
ncbi:MAG TPA: Gfo/Idh/MocA family oxidoreductase [Opitutaceae bacterium]|nr:Gfo/Idh/MocA family oxidoreductase [Opitutaceae bacterium]